MKRRITLTAALTLSVVLVSLMTSDSTAMAQSDRTPSLDTGVITLGPNQILRVMLGNGDGAAVVRFRQMGYIEQDGVYKVAAQVTTDPIRLMPDEAASIDISQGQFNAVRGVILVKGLTKDMTGTLQIIDKATGQVNSLIGLLIS